MAKKKYALPKRILGVKLPKKLRKTSKALLSNGMARLVIADMLALVAAGLLQNQARKGSTTRNIIEHPVATAEAAGTAGLSAAAGLGKAAEALINYVRGSIEAHRSELETAEAEPRKGARRRQKRAKHGREGQRAAESPVH